MKLSLMPKPRQVKIGRSYLTFKHGCNPAGKNINRKISGLDRLPEIFGALKPAPGSVFVIAADIATARGFYTGESPSVAGALAGKGDEAYELDITSRRIVITAGGVRGAIWAAQTLRQLANQSNSATCLPCVHIRDWPAFPSRGVTLDCNAHLDGVANPMRPGYLRSIIDRMSRYKLNTLYLYSDWNLVKLDAAPELAPPGAWNKAQTRDLIGYAAKRGIEVIPQFNSFGHWSQAMARHYKNLSEAGSGMNFDPSNPAVYKFLDKIIGETAILFPSPWFHAGCDEVAVLGKCPRCKKIGADASWVRHINRLNSIVKKHGKRLIVYADFIYNECKYRPEKLKLLERLDADIILEYWKYVDFTHPGFRAMVRHDPRRAYQALSAGFTLERIIPAYGIRMDNIEGLPSRIQRAPALRKACRRVNIAIWQQLGRWLEPAWMGICRHADVAWQGAVGARRDFYARFSREFLGVDAPELGSAAEMLGKCNEYDRAGGDRITMTDLFVDIEGAVYDRFTREELLRRIAAIPSRVTSIGKILEKWRGKITRNPFYFENLVLAAERSEFFAHRILLLNQAREHYRQAVIRRHFSGWGDKALPPGPAEVMCRLRLTRACLKGIRRRVTTVDAHLRRIWRQCHVMGEVYAHYHGRRFDDYRRDLDGLIGELTEIIDNYEPDMYPSKIPQADRVFIFQGRRKYEVKNYN